MLKTDLERERRGKQGVENLAKALQETPTFGGEESQQDVNDKLQHVSPYVSHNSTCFLTIPDLDGL